MATYAELYVEESDVLHIVIGEDRCRIQGHDVQKITLCLPYLGHSEKVIGQYCRTCNQAQISRNAHAEMFQKYGATLCKTFLKGFDDVELTEPEPDYLYYFNTEFKERAEESPLKKMGYSVASDSGLSDCQRQALLSNAIRSGAVSKEYVKSYLSHLIQINGKKNSNWNALEKWKNDLEFVAKLC